MDKDPSRVARICREEGCQGTHDVKDSLKDPNIDAVIVASSTVAHYEHISNAMDANKPVVTEKPISYDRAQIDEIIHRAVASELPFMVGYQRRYDESFGPAIRQVKEGMIGTPHVIRTVSRDPLVEYPLDYISSSGGVFYDMLCHDFDLIFALNGGEPPLEVYSLGHAHNPDFEELDDLDTALCTLKFKSGLIATVECARVTGYGYDQRLEIFGDDKMIRVGNQFESTVLVTDKDGSRMAPIKHWFNERYASAYYSQLEAFIGRVESKTVEDEGDLLCHIVLETVSAAAELSWRLGRAIKLDEVQELRKHLRKHGG